MMGSALSFLVLGSSNIQLVSLVALFLSGLAGPPVFTTVMGLLQFSTPPEMRARVMGLFLMVSFGLQPIAALWIGWTAEPEHLGIQRAILLNAAMLLSAAFIMLYRTSLRRSTNVPTVAPVISTSEAGD